MLPKLREQEEAIKLRKLGWSLNEISDSLQIAKSSASLWLSAIELSEVAKERIQQKRAEARERAANTKRNHVDKKFKDARTYGEEVLSRANMSLDTVRLLCALIYWCEGTKIRRSEVMGFTNSDPQLMASFLKLLRAGFTVDETKLRLTVHVHEYHDAKEQLQFWSEVTNIPLTQCHKPYLKPHTALRTREGYPGCASVRYYDVDFGRRLEGIAKAFLEKGP